MRTITIENSDNFENVIESINNTIIEIQDLFDKQNVNMNKIDSSNIWTSDTQKEITSKYNELKGGYGDIIDSLNKYSLFMRNSLDSYKKLEHSINSGIEDNSIELNVN